MKGTIDRILAEVTQESKKEKLVRLAREMDEKKISVMVERGTWIRIPKGRSKEQAIQKFKKLHHWE